ncbi:permease [Mycolicibacterium sp. 018/SC-01/001]|uniref:permease n=1 Tax=Mycolicibacterium sp. 018/SC-01/001 TaxID=2592069 RepID=UPI001181577B|nr:permease [Mycolicibacterium sp. 018/SC-01/001]TRW80335.1 permease [Mycolicibacterium sp. 018/SC-01/001]
MVRTRGATVAGAAITVLVAVAGLTWAKWVPYVGKAMHAARTGQWSGSDILHTGGVTAGDRPSWHAATTFFTAYVGAIWPALVVALLLSACVQAFLPRSWLPALLNRRRPVSAAAAGAAAGMPSMMCTCCSAPVAVTLRRNGVDQAAAVAYWLGNPLLNPAVLVFLALVAPWQWTVTRLVVGTGAVIGAAVLVSRFTRPVAEPDPAVPQSNSESRPAALRFLAALGRLCVVLVPEYFVMVLVIGACRGWLLAIVDPAHRSLLIVVVVAVVGTLMVIPTAGEIPILQGLALVGVSSGVLGALLITLPAVSLPGIAMVIQTFGRRATVLISAAVVSAGLAAALALSVL